MDKNCTSDKRWEGFVFIGGGAVRTPNQIGRLGRQQWARDTRQLTNWEWKVSSK